MALSLYADADEKKLDDIIRLAEARLEAQLTLALAADQRAMTFASFLAAVEAAIIAVLAAQPGSPMTHVALLVLLVGLGAASLLALWSAQPIVFDAPGYRPGLWLKDLAARESFAAGRAVMAEHYDERIRDNDRAMLSNANWLRASMTCLVITLILAGICSLIF